MKVLVAGATGYLGRFVVREFKQRRHWVRVLARHPERLAQPGPFMAPAVHEYIDDLYVGEVTRPETLHTLCDGIDAVFSSVGITRQKDNLTFHDVDFLGNRNILDRALEAAVKRFVYVSVFNAELMENLAIVRAHEEFVRALRASGMLHAIIRPTGYYSDIGEFFRMAKSGRVYLIGDGRKRLNPIHGADLAEVCADTLVGRDPATVDVEIPVGGPVVYTQQQIAELAYSILGMRSKITHIPVWAARAAIGVMRVFNRHAADLFDFFATAGLFENVAPKAGTQTLERYFQELL